MSDPKRALQASSIVLERSNTNDFCASPKPFPVDTHVEVYWPGPDLSGIWSRGRVDGASWSPDEKQKFCYDISVQSSGNLDEFLLKEKPPHEVRLATPDDEVGGQQRTLCSWASCWPRKSDAAEQTKTTKPAATDEKATDEVSSVGQEREMSF